MTRLVRPSRIESFAELNDFALTSALSCGLPPEARPKLELVLEELLVNVIRYAYSGGEGDVAVECDREEGPPPRVRIRIEDAGRPFDPLALDPPDTTLGIDERSVGGLGVHLTRQMVDSIAYERRDGRNLLTFAFAANAAAPANTEE